MTILNMQFPCGECICDPGWAGPGAICGPDNDADGWPDIGLNCTEPSCTQVEIILISKYYC